MRTLLLLVLLASWVAADTPLRIEATLVDLTEAGRKNLWYGGIPASGPATVTCQESGQRSTGDPLEAPATWWRLYLSPLARTPFILQSNLRFLVENKAARIVRSEVLQTSWFKPPPALRWEDRLPVTWSDPRTGGFVSQELPLGLRLDIAPSGESESYVTVALRLQVTTLLEMVNGQYPRTLTKSAESTLRLRLGDYLQVGGVFTGEDCEAAARLPLMAELPFLTSLRQPAPRNLYVLFVRIADATLPAK